MAGFGGVAEYGITVRWNKNYLKLVRLLLERRIGITSRISAACALAAAPRLSMDDAWAMGFDHIALCMGAGKPTDTRHSERTWRAASGKLRIS